MLACLSCGALMPLFGPVGVGYGIQWAAAVAMKYIPHPETHLKLNQETYRSPMSYSKLFVRFVFLKSTPVFLLWPLLNVLMFSQLQ